MPENRLKIIAIQPLKGCEKKYSKVLELGRIYYLYQNYKIEEGSEQLVLTCDTVPSSFFASRGQPIHIDIAAIVGMNGSGKSTLIELLMMCINNLAFQFQQVRRDLVFVSGLKVALYFNLNGFRKIVFDGTENIAFRYHRTPGKMVIDEEFNLKSFFYSITVNYSHYAYNELDYAKSQRWLSGVFRKNDGYQIPININPFRSEGNIDINTENHLVKSRLMANVLRQSRDGTFDFRDITDNYRADFIQLKLKSNKPYSTLYRIGSEEVNLRSLQLQHMDELLVTISRLFLVSLSRLTNHSNKLVVDYIIYKLVSISQKYDEYQEYFDIAKRDFIYNKFYKYIVALSADSSHITYKLRQAINFLKFKHIKVSETKLNLDQFGRKIEKILRSKRSGVREPIELLPPPIFEVEIMLKRKGGTKIIPFKNLSSGEKQWNYSKSTFLYHLNNIDSISGQRRRIAFKHVLIILEEIELYFHPEMQRKYIKHVVESILNLQLRAIRSIQLLFVTHSPFILSDIPDRNVLFLNQDGSIVDDKETTRTFGGNIHELLARGFFMKDALVGDFARSKIEDMIQNVQENSKVPEDKEFVSDLRREIELIGEDFLREKLLEMFFEKFTSEVDKAKRIAELREELNRLENDQP